MEMTKRHPSVHDSTVHNYFLRSSGGQARCLYLIPVRCLERCGKSPEAVVYAQFDPLFLLCAADNYVYPTDLVKRIMNLSSPGTVANITLNKIHDNY